MKKVSLTIDGKKITATEGTPLLWVALDNDIYIPNLCAIRDKAEPAAACRLCFVEVEGKEQPVTACTETVTEGMVVNTKGAKALRLTNTAFSLIMASHPVDCACCPANRSCELQNIARHLSAKLKSKRFRTLVPELPIDDSHSEITYDPNKCVACGRCIWACRNNGVGILGFAHRGFERVVTTFGDQPLGQTECSGAAECITVCPTGAFSLKGNSKSE